MLAHAAAAWPDKVAVAFEDAELTYAEVWARATRAAQAFLSCGVEPHEPVLVMLDNSIEFVDAWLGLALAGAVQVPVNCEYRGEILRHQIKDSGARQMLLDEQYLPRLDELRADVGDLSRLLVSSSGAPERTGRDRRHWQELFAESTPSDRPPAAAAEHDIVAIMYTSGTTGPAKGVRVAHAHAYTYAELAGRALKLSEGDVYFAPLPLFHIAGQWALVYSCFQVGATATIRRRFSVTDFWPVVRQSGANVTFLLGAMANFLAGQVPAPTDADNPLERVLMVPLVDDVEEFRRRFDVCVCTCYGSTEANVPLVSDYDVSDPRLAGRIVPGFELRIVDENDREVADGETGELVVRAAEPWTLATAYHRNPEASLALFRNLWLHTGDAFRRDGDGNYYFVDRIKDYIRRRGENISSFEVEREVNAFPPVLECAAVAVPSKRTEDDLKVVIVPRPGETVDPDALRDFLRDRVPRFMVPDVVEVVAELPKTPTGKIRKNLLR